MTHVEAAAEHGSKSGCRESAWAKPNAAEQHVNKRLHGRNICRQFRSDHERVHASATAVGAAQVAGDPEILIEISGRREIPATQVRTTVRACVLISPEDFCFVAAVLRCCAQQ